MKKTLVWFVAQFALRIVETLGLWRWWPPIVGSSVWLLYVPHVIAATVVTIAVFRNESTRGKLMAWVALQLLLLATLRASSSPLPPGLALYLIYAAVATFVTWLVYGRIAEQGRCEMSEAGASNPYFRCAHFSIEVDDAASAASIRGSTSRWEDAREGGGKPPSKGGGSVNHRLALLGLSRGSLAEQKTRSVAQVATGTGTGTAFVNGQSVAMSAPVSVTTGYSHYTEATGRHAVWIHWKETSYILSAVQVARARDGTLERRGFAIADTKKDKFLSLSFAGVPDDVKTAFEEHFWPQIESRRVALEKNAKDAALNAAWADAERKFLDVEAAANALRLEREAVQKAADDTALAAALAKYKTLVDGCGVNGDFNDWQYDATSGKILWVLMVDHSGAALLAGEGECWSGVLSGAKVLRGKVASRPADEELSVEVRDPDYEATHLKRRRFDVLGGRSAKVLTEWVDRIEILAAR